MSKGRTIDSAVRIHAIDDFPVLWSVFLFLELHRLFPTLLDIIVIVDSDYEVGVVHRREGVHQHPRLRDLSFVDLFPGIGI